MKTLILTIALLIGSIAANAQTTCKVIKITKEYPCYSQIGNMLVPSNIQVKTADSLKKVGFKPIGVKASGRGTIIVTYIGKSH